MRPLSGGLTGVIYQLAFAPDGGSLLARDSARGLGVWDVASGGFREWPREPTGATAFAMDPTGARVAVVNGWGECVFFRWPNGTGLRVAPARQTPEWRGVQALAFDRDGRRLAAATNRLHVWDTTTLDHRVSPSKGTYTAVQFVPGTSIVAAVDTAAGRAVRWDYEAGGRRSGTPVKGSALALACSPDGSVIAVGAGGGVDLLDAGGKNVGRGEVPGLATVTDLAFTPDGRRLLVAAGTPRVTALDPRAAAEVGAFDFGVDKAFAVAVAPDGLTAAVGGMGGRVVVFDLDG